MAITRSIRNKLFLLLMLMGAMPLIIITMFSAANTAAELEDKSQKVGELRNAIISHYVTGLCEKNFHVLKSLALNEIIIKYLQTPEPEKLVDVQHILFDTNTIFHDKNLSALTGADGQQIVRTDGAPLVDLTDRKHFQEAMRGKVFVSDVLISRSTGKRIVVLEVPVRNKLNYPIGMVQRNFNLDGLQDFIKVYDTEEISIIVMDRKGMTIAHSDEKKLSTENEDADNARYKYIADMIKDNSGTMRLNIDGKDSLVSYSRNWTTDWIIITAFPYDLIMEQIYVKTFETISLGVVILVVLFITAYLMSFKATRPIAKITDATDKIVSGKDEVDKIEIDTNDEFGQIAAAFNKMRSSRDAYQMEAERDTLTKLYNKNTTENIGKMKLKAYSDGKNIDSIAALFVIDLDHFKEANDTHGHQFGDKVLIEFSKNLKKKFRPTDCVGRFGGDEFIVILDNLPELSIVIRKARDIKNIAANLVIDGVPAGITASIGIAIVPQDGTEYEKVFKAADEALYYVKANGRNGFYYKDAEGIS